MENVDIMVTDFLPTDLPVGIVYGISMAYVLAGLLQKISNKIRPRETTKGETDKCLDAATERLAACFAAGISKEETFKAIISDFLKIERHTGPLPQVGIVGDLFVRDNDTFNQNLIHHIEEIGAEAVTVPFIDTVSLQVDLYFKTQWQNGRYLNLLRDKVAYNMLTAFSKKLNAIASPILHNGSSGLAHDPLSYLQKHSLTIRHAGETSENLLKVYYLKENYPDLRLIINAYPIFCCPGLISEAMYKNVEKEIGVPIVSITYDGTQADKNKVLNPYLYFLTKKEQ
jgi:predicted nucleotide-binding protein (sugar kinase/HSP70/actin superfamily)